MEKTLNSTAIFSVVFASLICLSYSAVADDIDPAIGSWVGKGASCRAIKDMSDERVMKISKKNIHFYEGICRIRSAKKSGALVTVLTICESEGEAERKTLIFDVISKTELRIKDGFTYVRCP